MKAARLLLFFIGIWVSLISHAQTPVDSIQFFLEEKPLELILKTDLKVLLSEKPQGKNYLPATFMAKLPDSTQLTEQIRLTTRGQIRRTTCYIPPIKLNFHNSTSPRTYTLHTLKMVSGCKTGDYYEQLLLKEYLCYKIYNLLTDLSFRVRLLHVTYEDANGKKKPFTQYAFVIEDIKELARRNHCKERKGSKVYTEQTDRKNMTLVSLFEYMIANTDWAVPVNHNIRLLYPKKDSLRAPYAIAYDFDYAGLVNAEYAVPDPKLEIESVTQRLYRGFPRSMGELKEAIKIFDDKKESIYALINQFEPLSARNKKEVIGYLEDFYKTIHDDGLVKNIFIENARKE